MNIPKEIIDEIGSLVQPKYKCMRIKYFKIDHDFVHDESGFKIRQGEKIYILDDT